MRVDPVSKLWILISATSLTVSSDEWQRERERVSKLEHLKNYNEDFTMQ